jgi:hypothetical protein
MGARDSEEGSQVASKIPSARYGFIRMGSTRATKLFLTIQTEPRRTTG